MEKPENGQRRHLTAEEKVAILRKHFLEKVPVSALCEQARAESDGLLPLAEGVLRERGGGVRAAAGRAESGSCEEKVERSAGQARPEGRGHGRIAGGARRAKKKSWGGLKASWVQPDVRDEVVDFVRKLGREDGDGRLAAGGAGSGSCGASTTSGRSGTAR